jgi:hypothetical protein
MISLWSLERAQNILDHWDNYNREKLLELIADAIEKAEEYGENRFKDTNELRY